MMALPDLNRSNRYLKYMECLQILACTEDEFALLKDAVLSIGMRTNFDGQSLLDQNFKKFDSFGRHRRALWADVESSHPLFAALLAGTRQKCDPGTWSKYVTKVKAAIITQAVKPKEKISRTNRARSMPQKRSTSCEVMDLDNVTEYESEHVIGLETMLELGLDERPAKRAKLSRRPSDAPESSSSVSKKIAPFRKNVDPPAQGEEVSGDHQHPADEMFSCQNKSSEEFADGFADKMMALVKQHLNRRTAELDATFEARVAAQVTVERGKIDEERAELAKERQELELVVEQRVQKRVSEEEQKLKSVIMGEAEAQVAAERNEIGILVEREVQVRLAEERIKWEEVVAEQLKSLF